MILKSRIRTPEGICITWKAGSRDGGSRRAESDPRAFGFFAFLRLFIRSRRFQVILGGGLLAA